MKVRRSLAAAVLAGLLLCLTACGSRGSPLKYEEMLMPGQKTTYRCEGLKKRNDKQLEELTIPSEYKGGKVTQIGSYAFSGNEYLKRIWIPDTVTHIRTGAFVSSALEELVLPASLEDTISSEYRNYISDCPLLRTLVIREPITEYTGVSGCPNLREVQLPNTVDKFYVREGEHTMDGLTDVYYEGTSEQWWVVRQWNIPDQLMTVHCTDATMLYQGGIFLDYLEFDGAWWLEDTILPEYTAAMEAQAEQLTQERQVQQEPEPDRPGKKVGMDDMVLDRVVGYSVRGDGLVWSVSAVSDLVYNERGNVTKRTQYVYENPSYEVQFEYDGKDRLSAYYWLEYVDNEEESGFFLYDQAKYEYDKQGRPVKINYYDPEYETFAYDDRGNLTAIWGYYSGWDHEYSLNEVFGPYAYEYSSDGTIVGVKNVDEDGNEITSMDGYGNIRVPEIPSLLTKDLESKGLQFWKFMNAPQPEECLAVHFLSEGPFPDQMRFEYDGMGRISKVYTNDWGRDGNNQEFMYLEFQYQDNGTVYCWGFNCPSETYHPEAPGALLVLEYAPLGTQLEEREGIWDVSEPPEDFYYDGCMAEDWD